MMCVCVVYKTIASIDVGYTPMLLQECLNILHLKKNEYLKLHTHAYTHTGKLSLFIFKKKKLPVVSNLGDILKFQF